MADSNDGPTLIRPIPRRVFDLNPRCPTPPEDDQPIQPSSPPAGNVPLNLESLNSRLLGADFDNNDGYSDSGSISRAQSILNLTGSTLMGIYGPSSGGKSRDDTYTPWGTGAETPARGLSTDEPYYETLKERAKPTRRRSSLHSVADPSAALSTPAFVFHVGLRTILLASLGAIYGMLVAQVQGGQKIASFYVDGMIDPSGYDWRYLGFWALSGVALGSLLPWFDRVWETITGLEEDNEVAATEADQCDEKLNPETDWALAIRGVGAFIGIAFAIRKVPWDSAMQASLTLALVNPALWFLIDRSMPGFILSAAVGLAGSLMLMGLKPDMVPVPTNPLLAFTGGFNASNATTAPQLNTVLLGGLVRQQTMETGIWMLSILFCCSVCFGNVGRRLALDRTAIAKGRWALG